MRFLIEITHHELPLHDEIKTSDRSNPIPAENTDLRYLNLHEAKKQTRVSQLYQQKVRQDSGRKRKDAQKSRRSSLSHFPARFHRRFKLCRDAVHFLFRHGTNRQPRPGRQGNQINMIAVQCFTNFLRILQRDGNKIARLVRQDRQMNLLRLFHENVRALLNQAIIRLLL